MKCVVPGCLIENSPNKETLSFHRFPTDPQRKLVWLQKLNIDEVKITNKSVVCSRHFLPEMIIKLAKKSALRLDAIPQLKLSRSNDIASDNCDSINGCQTIQANVTVNTSHGVIFLDNVPNLIQTGALRRLKNPIPAVPQLPIKLVTLATDRCPKTSQEIIPSNNVPRLQTNIVPSKAPNQGVLLTNLTAPTAVGRNISSQGTDIPLINFSKICRLCLSTDTEIKPLFSNNTEENNEMVKIRVMINAFGKCPVAQYDRLPDKICVKCIDKVRASLDFIQQCERSYAKLALILKPYGGTSRKNRTKTKKNNSMMQGPASASAHRSKSNVNVLHTKAGSAYLETLKPLKRCNANNNLNRKRRLFRCNICDKMLTDRHRKNIHKKIHIRKPYACKICHKNFTLLDDLVAHQLKAHKNTPFECSECNINYREIRSLKTHLHNKHQGGPHVMQVNKKRPSLKCDVCGHRFKTISTLRHHQRIYDHHIQHDLNKVYEINVPYEEIIIDETVSLNQPEIITDERFDDEYIMKQEVDEGRYMFGNNIV